MTSRLAQVGIYEQCPRPGLSEGPRRPAGGHRLALSRHGAHEEHASRSATRARVQECGSDGSKGLHDIAGSSSRNDFLRGAVGRVFAVADKGEYAAEVIVGTLRGQEF